MNMFETDGKECLAFLAELWQKLDAQIRQTHGNLEKLIEAKIRIEQELSGTGQSIASDQQQVTAADLEHFQAVSREATMNFFRDRLEQHHGDSAGCV